MTDEEAAVTMDGLAAPFEHVGMTKAAEPYRRAADALRVKGMLVEALEWALEESDPARCPYCQGVSPRECPGHAALSAARKEPS